MPIRPSRPEATASAFGLRVSCVTSSLPMSWARDMRVTMIACAVESSSAGTCATRPSPMVSRVYTRAASLNARSWLSVPMARPPTMLTSRIMMPAVASPRTNLLAPSIEP